MDEPGPPAVLPIGLMLARTARVTRRAFDQALGEAGGSLSVWLILLNVKVAGELKQRDLATAVGLSEATLTHHLAALEADGLVARRRAVDNRRVQLVELTGAGEQRFIALRDVAFAFDTRLRQGFTTEEQTDLARFLDRLTENVAASDPDAPPWKELIE
jgi:MarR family transcriptional regulator for hemolysin